jgi:Winged helix DNA-binding domain
VAREAGPVQAQEPRAARLAFRARARDLTASDVDRARTEERSLFRAWLMRKTVHLIPSEDAGWLLPLFAPTIVRWSRKRLGDLGLEPGTQQRALRLIHEVVEREGPLPRPVLVRRLTDAGFEAATDARYHLWTLATLDGELCLGPDRDGQACLVRTEDWLGKLKRRSREDSLAELARRYLRAYGPATERDLARWAGLPLRDGRAGLKRIAAELGEARVGGETLLVLGAVPRAAPGPVVRLLGAYDNYNLGYASRDFAVPPEHVRRIVPGGGIVRPAIVADGRFIGTWSSKRSSGRLTVSTEPFARLDPGVAAALEAEVADVGRFEGLKARSGSECDQAGRSRPDVVTTDTGDAP